MINALKSVLLVEDNELDVELTLEAFKGNNLANSVQVVRDGEEALEYLYREGRFQGRPEGNPILVLLDLKMPKVNGLDVLRKVKADPDLKSIPIVMLTTSKEEQDLVESYKLGVNAYVVKPVHFPDFVTAISQLGTFWALVNNPPPGSVRQ
ncbi:MAG: response regulator with CheY-like receiver domain and winged-helix DNA-binding domain [Fibrobacteres bacterium]|nr:response regulator with CheY-like receiver domain and winged-helix DNA-binding domain [Fibrobacterota bacterium]